MVVLHKQSNVGRCGMNDDDGMDDWGHGPWIGVCAIVWGLVILVAMSV